MIKFDLSCKCGKTFESWFASSKEFTALSKKKLVRCIDCDSTSIKKSIMSPNLVIKSNKKLDVQDSAKKVKKELLKFRKYIEKNCKNVGDNFAQEARNIHYDNKKSKGIYGKATAEETSELQDEGIDIATIPWVDKFEN
tara:strand:- start:161 stop:577 length:417 start_codon:yes stop_codon:yes gene_type:complete